MTPRLTPLGALGRGLLAGAAGTAAMDLVWFARYRRAGGEDGLVDWELSTGLEGWEGAPAPAQVGRRVVEGLFQRELPPSAAAFTNNVTHWGYGMAWGAPSAWWRDRCDPGGCATGWRWAPSPGRRGTWSCPWRSSTSPSGSTTSRRWRAT